MKRIVILMLVMTTTAAFAQRPNHGRNGQKKAQMAQLMEELSAQQLAELETKKLTLALDLNDAQQTQMLAVQTEIAQDRKAAHARMKALKESDEIKKPTAEEKFQKMSEGLDKKIEIKQQIKQILTADQYKKWEKMQHHKKQSRKAHRGKRR